MTRVKLNHVRGLTDLKKTRETNNAKTAADGRCCNTLAICFGATCIHFGMYSQSETTNEFHLKLLNNRYAEVVYFILSVDVSLVETVIIYSMSCKIAIRSTVLGACPYNLLI